MNKVKKTILITSVLSFLLTASSFILRYASDIQMSTKLSASCFPIIKAISIYPTLFLTIIILIVSRKIAFEKIFQRSLIYFTLAMAFSLTCVLIQDLFSFQTLSLFLEKSLPLPFRAIASHKALFLFHSLTNLMSYSFLSLLIWGFVNQVTSRNEAFKLYIPLACILWLVSSFVKLLLSPILITTNWSLPSHFAFAVTIALFLILAAAFTFKKYHTKLTDNEPLQLEHNKSFHFPILSSAYLLVGALAAGSFTHVIFQSELRPQFASSSTAYISYLGKFSAISGSLTVLFTLVWLVLGTKVLVNQGINRALKYGVAASALGAVAFFTLFNTKDIGLLFGQSISKSILISTTSCLFFPVIQILYLYLPQQVRFQKKVVTEMIAMPIIKSSSLFIVQSLIIAFGSLQAAKPYLLTLFALFIAILYLASRSVKSKLPKLKEVSG
ncbi:MAG: hypothetical protein S4CHLAM6_00260 [Chlamydiae bacterium]|nr:hypothetical protein [Chlamydiota bacterium]